MRELDCLVIGAGIAGITAGIYLKRGNAVSLVLDKDAPGGKLNNIHRIDNYPGEASIAGPDLSMKLFSQATSLNVEFGYDVIVELKKEGNRFKVTGEEGTYLAKAVIVATGIENKKLDVPGEATFNGRGVSYCATCDGNFFKGQDVVVYGYKDHAVEDAIYLASLAKTVYLLSPNPLETTESHEVELASLPNAKIITGVKLKRICGENKVSGVIFEKGGVEEELPCAGVFQLFGEKSSSQFLSSLGVDSNKGFIKVDSACQTNVPGLFAAGDVIDKRLRQLVNAAGEGAVAASMALSYIRGVK